MMKEFLFLNSAIAVIPAAGGRIENISAAFDEDPSIVRWTPPEFSSARRSAPLVPLQHRSRHPHP